MKFLPVHPPEHRAAQLSSGFTLVEIMVVVAIIAVIAAISAPSFRVAVLQGHLQDAKPFLMRISAAQRSHNNRTGDYYPAAGADAMDEQDIEDNLGVNLREAGDFCFVIRRTAANFSSNMTNPTPTYEIWAVLRDDAYVGGNSANDTVTIAGAGGNCVTADQKNEATGWVQDADAASEGRMVVLRYPPPSDRFDTGGVSHRSVTHDWVSGISERDALLD